jgi:tetratricopeptide (TPR) repeat protein
MMRYSCPRRSDWFTRYWSGPRPALASQSGETVPGSFLRIVIFVLTAAALAKALQNEQNLQTKLEHAQTLVRGGDLTAAEKDYQAIIQLDPQSYGAHNDLGALYMSEKRYDSACHEFARAANLNQALPTIQQNLGLCSIQTNQFSQAVEALKIAEALDPSDLRTRYFLGYSLLMLNRVDEAQLELDHVLSRKPDDDSTLFYLIRIYTQKKDFGKAADAFRELSKTRPDSVFVHILSGESYDLQDRSEEAIAEFKKAVELAPDMPRLHFGLGFLYWEGQRFREAAAELGKELRVNPHFAPAHYYLGDIALNRSDYRAAEEFFERARIENPACLDAYLGLGKTYARMGQWQRALEEFQLANKIDSGQRDVHYWLGTTLRHLGKQAESAREVRICEELAGKMKTSATVGEVRRERSTAKTCLPAPQLGSQITY